MKNYILFALAGTIIFNGCATSTTTSDSDQPNGSDESTLTVEFNKDDFKKDVEEIGNQAEKQVDEIAASIQLNYEQMMGDINQEIDVLQRQARTASSDVSSDLSARIDVFERKKETIKNDYNAITIKTPDKVSVKVNNEGWNNVKADMDTLWSDLKKEVDNGVTVTVKTEGKQ